MGEDYTIQVDFGAKPPPHYENVTWVIESPDGDVDQVLEKQSPFFLCQTLSFQIALPEQDQYIYADRYLVHQIKPSDMGNNRYVAMLTIKKVQKADGDKSYSLRVDQMSESAGIVDTSVYRYVVTIYKSTAL